MRFPSSIFSFDTWQVRCRVSRALVFALVLLAVHEFGIARSNLLFRIPPANSVSEFLSKEQRLRNAGTQVQVIILGDSRSMTGIDESEFERLLGLSRGSVLNLSLSSATPHDATLLLERNREAAPAVHLLIYCISDWQLNANFARPYRFHHFATWQDRLRLEAGWEMRLGYIFRTWEMQEVYSGISRSVLQHLAARSPGAVASRLTDSRRVSAAEYVDGLYHRYELTAGMGYYLQELLHQTEVRGWNTLVIQMPVTDEYWGEVRTNHAAAYALYKQSADRLTPASVPVAFFESASACGLQDADYADYGHLNREGARKFTQYFFDYLSRQHPQLIEHVRDRH